VPTGRNNTEQSETWVVLKMLFRQEERRGEETKIRTEKGRRGKEGENGLWPTSEM